MTHRIKPGDRYKLDPSGPIYENILPHDIIVDRQPIFVGGRVADGPFDLFKPREPSFGRHVGTHYVLDIETHPFDTAPYRAARANYVRKQWMATRHDIAVAWPSPKKDSPFPAFQAPARPTEPEAAKPEPDTPAVATLKALLANRHKEVRYREGAVTDEKENVAECADALVEAERALETAKKDLAHAETVLAAAEAEVKTIVSDIEKLGGKVD